jgi:DNA adenine methylase
MKYMGSKNRIAKEILPIILKNRKLEQWYVEPFCGGCNSLDKVDGKRIGNDINKYLIALLKEMQKEGFSLPFIGEKEYKEIKENKEDYPEYILGYVGFQLSFGSKWFGGYRRDSIGKRNYSKEAMKNIMNQIPYLSNVVFYNKNYWELDIPGNSIIYCDPPYEGTTKYKDGFDHERYWSWVREMVKKGHEVYCSEYNAPEDFICIWEKELTTGLDTKSTKKDVEKLFVHKSQFA